MNTMLDGFIGKLTTWKNSLRFKEQKKTMEKTKELFSNPHKGVTKNIEEYLCAACHLEIGGNSILCSNCKHLINRYCSSIKCRVRTNTNSICEECKSGHTNKPQEQVANVHV